MLWYQRNWWSQLFRILMIWNCTICTLHIALACITIERASQWWLDRTTGSSVTMVCTLTPWYGMVWHGMVCTLTPSEPGQTTDMQPATKPELRLISITGQDPTGCLPPKEHTMEYNQPKNELFSLKVDKVNFNQTDRMIWAESQIYRKAQKLKSYCVPDSERLTVRHVAKSIPDDISLEQLPKQRMPMTDRVQRNFTKQSKQRTRMKQVSLLQMPSVGSCQN